MVKTGCHFQPGYCNLGPWLPLRADSLQTACRLSAGLHAHSSTIRAARQRVQLTFLAAGRQCSCSIAEYTSGRRGNSLGILNSCLQCVTKSMCPHRRGGVLAVTQPTMCKLALLLSYAKIHRTEKSYSEVSRKSVSNTWLERKKCLSAPSFSGDLNIIIATHVTDTNADRIKLAKNKSKKWSAA